MKTDTFVNSYDNSGNQHSVKLLNTELGSFSLGE